MGGLQGACELVIEKFGKSRLVADLAPDDFEALRAAMVKKQWGVTTIGNVIQRVRVVFKYAYDSDLIDRPVRYGQTFKRPSRKSVRIDRAKKEPKLFSADEVRKLIDGATVKKGEGRAARSWSSRARRCDHGHAAPHTSSRDREGISDERLRAVADHIRKWVFGEEEKAEMPQIKRRARA